MLQFANSNFHYFRYPFERFVRESRKMGFSKVLMWGTVPHLWADSYGHEPLDPVLETLSENGMTVAGYMPRIYSYSFFADPNSPQAAASMGYYRDSIDIAKRLNAEFLCFELMGSVRDRSDSEQIENSVKTVRDLAQEALGKHVVPVLSSADRLVVSADDMNGYLTRLSLPEVGLALDVAAVLTAGDTVSQWFDRFGDRIRLVYLSDGRISGGYTLGTGCFPLEFVLRELEANGYRGNVCIKLDRDRYELDPFAADLQNVSVLEHLGYREGIK